MSRRVKLDAVLPPFLREVRELRRLMDALTPEAEGLWSEVERLRRELFVETAGEEGLRRLEGVAGLAAGQAYTEARRDEVRLAYAGEAPYTLGNLRRLLRGLSPLAELGLDVAAQRVDVQMPAAQLAGWPSLAAQLREMVPANLALRLGYEGTLEFAGDEGAYSEESGFAAADGRRGGVLGGFVYQSE